MPYLKSHFSLDLGHLQRPKPLQDRLQIQKKIHLLLRLPNLHFVSLFSSLMIFWMALAPPLWIDSLRPMLVERPLVELRNGTFFHYEYVFYVFF